MAKRDPLMTQTEIIRKYGLNKNTIDKYFPKPMVRYSGGNGKRWIYHRYWTRSAVENAVKLPEVQKAAEEIREQERLRQQQGEVRKLLQQYNPDSLVERGKQLKRVFVLHCGPTNSGKTHDALQALMSSGCGAYLGPLRLLALEMYDRINGAGIKCSLLTGEEHIEEEGAEIVSSTIELCDCRTRYRVAVIDEAQLITDSDRGSSWFRAICLVDAEEVHICLAPEALEIIEDLVRSFGDPYSIVRHERLVPLVYSGRCRGYRDIRPNDAIICFSRKNVLSTAALLEKNGFRCSVIYGALPPAARRSEVERYLAGETNIVVATDAIGMGISLPIRRVVFAETSKFDGRQQRNLNASEVKQIAGRAGRYGMFELGEVLTMDNTDIVSSGLKKESLTVHSLCVGFPREVLETDYPIDLLLKTWKTLPDSRTFTREDVSDAIALYSLLKDSAKDKNRELIYDLITCPVDVRTQELCWYWLDCARAILRGRRVPEPSFDTDTLMGCELQYKAYDIRHQLLMRIGAKDNSSEKREEICGKIKELMAQDKSAYIRKCESCGKELPIGYPFKLCRKCRDTGRY